MLNLCTLCKLELISRKLDFKTNASLVPLFFQVILYLLSCLFICLTCLISPWAVNTIASIPSSVLATLQQKNQSLCCQNSLQNYTPTLTSCVLFCPRKKKKLYLVCNSRWKIRKKCLWRYTKTVLTSSFSQTSNNLCNTWASVNLEYLKTAHLDWIASD